MSVSPEDFLTSLQIVNGTRDQPALKAVYDFHMKKLVDHAADLAPKPVEEKKADMPKITLPPERVNTNLLPPDQRPYVAQPISTPPTESTRATGLPIPPQRRMGEEIPLTPVRSPDGPPDVTLRRPGGPDAA